MVLTNDDGPRNRWPLGVIASVFPSRDGIVRSVSIKTRSGDSGVLRLFRRAANDLVLLVAAEEAVA